MTRNRPHDDAEPGEAARRRPHRWTSAEAKVTRARRGRSRGTDGATRGNPRATRPGDLRLIAQAQRRVLQNRNARPREITEAGRVLLEIRKLEGGENPAHPGAPAAPPRAPMDGLSALDARVAQRRAARRAAAPEAAEEGEASEPDPGTEQGELTAPPGGKPPATGTEAQAAEEATASAPEPPRDPTAAWNQWDWRLWITPAPHHRVFHEACIRVARAPFSSHVYDPRRDRPLRKGEPCAGCGWPLREP